jgi:hypothetical protein
VEIKRELKQINLPLPELKALREGLRNKQISEFLKSDAFKDLERDDRFIELVLRLEAHNLLGESTHLAHIYSGLPAEIKRELKKIDLPLPELKGIHQALRHPQMIEWIQNNLRAHPPEERLEVLRDTLKERGVTVSRQKLYGALPHQLAEEVFKRDISTACVRLDLEDQTVFFDSGEERIVAQLLYRYGLIKKFTPGENLHIRVDESRASLDFKIGPVFLEYHPLSHRDRAAGLTEEAASDQKRARLDTARFRDHRVVVITRLKDLYTLLRTDPDITSLLRPEYRALTPSGFTGHLKAAKAYGHAIDRAVRAAREAEPVTGDHHGKTNFQTVASIV